MSARIDQELAAGPLAYSGTFWQRHAESGTRRILEHVARASSLVDFGATAHDTHTEVTHATFRIVDGDFSVLGRDPEAFAFSSAGGSVTGLRTADEVGRSGNTTAWPGKLIIGPDSVMTLPAGHDWCVFRCPQDMLPLVLESAVGTLVRGIDFLSVPGLVAVRDDPGDLWPDGVVLVLRGRNRRPSPYTYVLSGDTGQVSTRWLAEYARNRQSLVAFRRAAAEYCRMVVLADDDLVLRYAGDGVYIMAKAGAVSVDYPHAVLQVGKVYPAGYVVCGLLDIFTPRWADGKSSVSVDEFAEIHLPGADGITFSLDGLVPVNGLTWDTSVPVTVSAGSPSPRTGIPYGEWGFDGDPVALASLNATQAAREDATGMPLATEFDALPVHLDFGALIADALGSSLLAVVSDLTDWRAALLTEFVRLHRPYGCVALCGFK